MAAEATEGGSGRRGFRVTGRVQGVGFRWWTQRTASSLGLRGTVRNCADGSVEVHAAGPSKAVDTLGRKLEDGPGSARVAEVEEIEARDDLPETFRIVR